MRKECFRIESDTERELMGLCSSKTTVAVAPYAGIQSTDSGDQADSTMQASIWDDQTSTAQADKNKADPEVWSRGANRPAKGYLELQTSQEEKEDSSEDEVVELLNVSDSEGSLRSQFLD